MTSHTLFRLSGEGFDLQQGLFYDSVLHTNLYILSPSSTMTPPETSAGQVDRFCCEGDRLQVWHLQLARSKSLLVSGLLVVKS